MKVSLARAARRWPPKKVDYAAVCPGKNGVGKLAGIESVSACLLSLWCSRSGRCGVSESLEESLLESLSLSLGWDDWLPLDFLTAGFSGLFDSFDSLVSLGLRVCHGILAVAAGLIQDSKPTQVKFPQFLCSCSNDGRLNRIIQRSTLAVAGAHTVVFLAGHASLWCFF